jgi:3-hydroxyisobutyrate dehydrogenase-like beta-hydroxyacid dehydrogenase
LKRILFIGYGEASYHISLGLKMKGFTHMIAYDKFLSEPSKKEGIMKRAKEVGINVFDTVEEAVEKADFIISLTSSKVAYEVAENVIPIMNTKQIFFDFNSASPVTMQQINEIAKDKGVRFCDVAVMSAVPLEGSSVPLLMSGEGSLEFYNQMKDFGMNMEILNTEPGGASAVKMIRSIFMKGYPSILVECLLAAEFYGVTEKILDSIEASLGGKTIRQLANRFLTPTIVHADRRSSEMREVVSMLNMIGNDSTMSQATEASHKLLSELHIDEQIGINEVLDYKEIIPIILSRNNNNNLKIE